MCHLSLNPRRSGNGSRNLRSECALAAGDCKLRSCQTRPAPG
jgi:hypothetical protein